MTIINFEGYHGTTIDITEKIIKTSFTIDRSKIGWLGTGVYFFERNESLAKMYAEKRFNGKITNVIKTSIEVPEDEVFDVTDPFGEHNNFFHTTRRIFVEEQLSKHKLNVRSTNSKNFDGAIYNLIAQRKGYKLIRALTYTPPELEQKAHIEPSKVPNGIELCLKQVSYVKAKHSLERGRATR